jgi:hypothetical protein
MQYMNVAPGGLPQPTPCLSGRYEAACQLVGDAVLLGEIACACQRAAFGRGGAGQCLSRRWWRLRLQS